MRRLLCGARRWGREPLVHFLAASLLLFAIDGWLARGTDAEDTIVIGSDYIESLIAQHHRRAGRAPTSDELRTIVWRHATEEALIRYGQSFGLHSGDPMVRRRVLQKVYFMAEALATAEEPSEKDLHDYLLNHADTYRRPSMVRVSQVYFATDDADDGRIHSARAALDRGADPESLGQMLPLGHRLGFQTASSLDHLFGTGFSDALANLPEGVWTGPMASRYGQHLVRVDARQPERLPALAEIRPRVRQDLMAKRREQARHNIADEVLQDFRVAIDWPDAAVATPVVITERMP